MTEEFQTVIAVLFAGYALKVLRQLYRSMDADRKERMVARETEATERKHVREEHRASRIADQANWLHSLDRMQSEWVRAYERQTNRQDEAVRDLTHVVRELSHAIHTGRLQVGVDNSGDANDKERPESKTTTIKPKTT